MVCVESDFDVVCTVMCKKKLRRTGYLQDDTIERELGEADGTKT